MYRYHTLEIAQQQASEFGLSKGAMYAWRTINGYEASSYWLAGMAQFHINADIAFAIEQYYTITGDDEFLKDYGFEIILETARFWMQYGNFTEMDGKRRFVINKVTGPDEYSALVDNNYYTNVMAQFNLRLAIKYAKKFKNTSITSKLNISEEEIDAMQEAADLMYLPYDKQKKVKLQFQGFEQLPKMHLDQIDQSLFPLLLHFHPLMLYRYQVNKQADTIMADILFPKGNTREQLEADYDFYEPITTHDSSLSKAMYAIAASRAGKKKQSYDFFSQAVKTDLLDLHHNTQNGIHAGSLGAAWQGVVYGFAGVVNNAEHFSLEPKLPAAWNSIRFKLRLHHNECLFTIYQNEVKVELTSGKECEVFIYNQKVHVTTQHPQEICTY